MHRESILIALGVLIAVSPYLGLPYAWLMFMLPIFGFIVLAIGLSLQMRRRARVNDSAPNETNPAL